MKIAVTGVSGFVGQAVADNLKDHGIEVISIGRDKTDYSVESLATVIRGADKIIHLAAVRGGDGAMADYHDNERITENLLTAMTKAEADHIIFASSRMVYSGEELIPWKETDLPAPNSLYGISKLEGENLCSYFSRKYGFGSTCIRIAQVMGTGDKVRNMMTVFLEKAARGEPLTVIGESRAKRQYIYVRDLAEVICRIATDSTGAGQEVINAGMERSYTNLEIAQIISKVFGLPAPAYDDSKPETITPSIMDVSRMIGRTGFRPRDMQAALEDIRL